MDLQQLSMNFNEARQQRNALRTTPAKDARIKTFLRNNRFMDCQYTHPAPLSERRLRSVAQARLTGCHIATRASGSEVEDPSPSVFRSINFFHFEGNTTGCNKQQSQIWCQWPTPNTQSDKLDAVGYSDTVQRGPLTTGVPPTASTPARQAQTVLPSPTSHCTAAYHTGTRPRSLHPTRPDPPTQRWQFGRTLCPTHPPPLHVSFRSKYPLAPCASQPNLRRQSPPPSPSHACELPPIWQPDGLGQEYRRLGHNRALAG